MKRKFGILALFSVLVFLVTACSSGTTTPTLTPDFSISAGNASIEEGATGTVTITITPKNNFEDEVTLTINNPADVTTATFSPQSAKATSILTLGSSKAGTYDMFITAKSVDGTLTRTADVTLTVTAKTVEPLPLPPVQTTTTLNGIVVDKSGRPFPNLPVIVLGQITNSSTLSTTALSTSTNANGEFTMEGVTKPYDIAVIQSFSEDVIIYKGLSSENPVLTFLDQSIENKTTGIVRGEVDQLFSNKRTRALFGSEDMFSSDVLSVDTNSRKYEGELDWDSDKTSINGKVYVLEGLFDFDDPNNTGFGYGSGSFALSANTQTTVETINMQPVGTSVVGGKVTFPNDYRLDYIAPYIRFDEFTVFDYAEILVPSQNGIFSFVTPQIPSGKFGIYLSADGPLNKSTAIYKTANTLNDPNMSFDIPAAPSLTLPINNASSVNNSTEFRWVAAGFAQSVYVVKFNGKGGAVDNRKITVITKDTNTTIPDLSAFGLNLAEGKSGDINNYQWRVSAHGPVTNMDEAVEADSVKMLTFKIGNDELIQSYSEFFKFTVEKP